MRRPPETLCMTLALLAGCDSGPGVGASHMTPAAIPVAAAARLDDGGVAPTPGSPVPGRLVARRLENAAASLRGLAELALAAVEARDAPALDALRVTESEYKEIFFPELPEASQQGAAPVDFQWHLLNLKSVKGLGDVIDELGGQRFELEDVIATGGVEEFKTFRAHRKVELKVRRASDGAELQVRLFGSVVERGGELKIFSFPG